MIPQQKVLEKELDFASEIINSPRNEKLKKQIIRRGGMVREARYLEGTLVTFRLVDYKITYSRYLGRFSRETKLPLVNSISDGLDLVESGLKVYSDFGNIHEELWITMSMLQYIRYGVSYFSPEVSQWIITSAAIYQGNALAVCARL